MINLSLETFAFVQELPAERMLLFGRDVIRRTLSTAQCVSLEAREEKGFSHLTEKTKRKCRAFAF